MEIPKPHNCCFYVGEHNIGRIALGNRIYVTCFQFSFKIRLRIQ